MRTRNTDVVTEEWRFHCVHCLRTWESLYEARHSDDGYGGVAVAWRLDGIASLPPWTDPSCPNCQSPCVKVLPAGPLVPRQR